MIRFMVALLQLVLVTGLLAQYNNSYDDIYLNKGDKNRGVAGEECDSSILYVYPRVLRKPLFKLAGESLSPVEVSEIMVSDRALQEEFKRAYIRTERGRQLFIFGLVTLPFAVYGDANLWERTETDYQYTYSSYKNDMGFYSINQSTTTTSREKYAFVATAVSGAIIVSGLIVKACGVNPMAKSIERYNRKGKLSAFSSLKIGVGPLSKLNFADGLTLSFSLNF